MNHGQTRHQLAAFQQADVGAVHPCVVGQLFLAQPSRQAATADDVPEAALQLGQFHGSLGEGKVPSQPIRPMWNTEIIVA